MEHKPTQKMASNAKRGLEERKKWKSNPPGTSVGVARARDIANRKNLSLSTLKRMSSFLARHEKNYKPKDRDSQNRLTRGTVSYLLWGGKEAVSWVEKEIKKAEAS